MVFICLVCKSTFQTDLTPVALYLTILMQAVLVVAAAELLQMNYKRSETLFDREGKTASSSLVSFNDRRESPPVHAGWSNHQGKAASHGTSEIDIRLHRSDTVVHAPWRAFVDEYGSFGILQLNFIVARFHPKRQNEVNSEQLLWEMNFLLGAVAFAAPSW